MTFIDELHINLSTESIAEEVRAGRMRAHTKHGANSIEGIAADDPRWLSILVEEVGEASHELTYDATGSLRAELIDVITVATAWVAALDREANRDEEPHPIIGRVIRRCLTCGDEAAYCDGSRHVSGDPYADCRCGHGRSTHVHYTGACGLCECAAVRESEVQE